MSEVKLLLGDCLIKLKELEADSVDSIVTDPPYELGFMNKGWDSSGIAFNKGVWEECLRVLKPGGHLLAFGGTRTYHRMTVAIEDSGLEIRDCIFWCYGSGFPKSHNIGKAVDKLQGNKREVIGVNGTKPNHRGNGDYMMCSSSGVDARPREENIITKGNSQWEGYGTALKPAVEPVVMARKPFKGSVANNVLEWGTGAINIDDCRVGYRNEADEKSSIPDSLNSNQKNSIFGIGEGHKHNNEGRWPANLIIDEEAGKMLDEQSGASRFFYSPKVSKSERNEGLEDGNTHPTVKPQALMAYLIKLVTPKGGTVLDPFMGSGSTGKAAVKEGYSFIGIEKEEEYFKIAEGRINVEAGPVKILKEFFE